MTITDNRSFDPAPKAKRRLSGDQHGLWSERDDWTTRVTFIHDVASRIATRIQLTTDGHKVYVNAVEDAFGADVDYAMLTKVYGERSDERNALQPGEDPQQHDGDHKRQPQSEVHQHVIR